MKNVINTNLFIAATFSTVLLTLSSVQAAPRCEHLFSDSMATKPLQNDLTDVHYYETRDLDGEAVNRMNQKTLDDLMAYIPKHYNEKRSHSLSFREANAIHQSIYQNKAAHPSKTNQYQKEGVNIGYCFGRSMYYHLMLLKKGLQKDSIKKIWAVGTMNTGSITWSFHVATLAYTKDKGWMVIDSNHYEPISPEKWMEHYKKYDTKNNLRFYITTPEKFSYNTGKYERFQLGLDVSRDVDWFKHYFKDMMSDEVQFKTEYTQLKPIKKVSDSEKFSIESMLNHIKKFVGIK